MQVINTQGIVLRAVKYKENDLILTIFTQKYGKVSAIARGARRQKSKMLSSSQIFSYNNYVLKRQKDMFTVSQADNIKSFYNISTDFESFSYASFILKLVELGIDEFQSNYRLFELVVRALFLFSENVDNKLYILDAFILKFIDFCGYRPIVDRCTQCGAKNYRYGVFSIENGGIVCDRCIDKEKFYIKIDPTTISLMQFILKNDIIVCSKAEVSKVLVDELYILLKRYIVNYFENIDFKPVEMLKKLK